MSENKQITATPEQMKDSFSATSGKATAMLNESFNFVFNNLLQNIERLTAENAQKDQDIAMYRQLYGTVTEEMRKKLAEKKPQTPEKVVKVKTKTNKTKK